MKSSKVFDKKNVSNATGVCRYFESDGTDHLDDSDLRPSGIVVPARAKHIQIIATVKETANSVDLASPNVLNLLDNDFPDGIFPKKEKWCHVVWW